ncbi:hypothetical protein MKW92_051120, partial [Papaver armeniacum]
MQIVDVPWIQDPQGRDNAGYLLAASKRSQNNFKREAGRAHGVVHLKVLSNFTINFPCSYIEMDVELSVCSFNVVARKLRYHLYLMFLIDVVGTEQIRLSGILHSAASSTKER